MRKARLKAFGVFFVVVGVFASPRRLPRWSRTTATWKSRWVSTPNTTSVLVASPDLRASLRKFLDWRAEPGWYEARDVTAAEWGAGFPERDWASAGQGYPDSPALRVT